MRLFVALDIEDAIRGRIARFLDGVRGFAPDAKWVRPESLHLTLKFIGKSEKLGQIRNALSGITADAVTVSFRGTGFFPTQRSARVLWIGIESDARLAQLAQSVDAALTPLGIESEKRAYTPHLTLARGEMSSRRPKSKASTSGNLFARLQEKLAALSPPDFGTMTAREFYLYESKLKPTGSVYTKLQGFKLN
jgi:2'-5' RNA ligase